MTTEAACRNEPELDQISATLSLFEGDANATIGALLAELQFVRGQLAVCQAGMSVGFTRGWVPTFDNGGDSHV